MNPHSYAHLIFDKSYNREKTASSTNAGKTGYLLVEN
jgi:hypothetical protein